MTNPTPLSPAAQAVLDAATNVFYRPLVETPYCHNRVVAAALRAVVGHCAPDDCDWVYIPDVLAIAVELEAQ